MDPKKIIAAFFIMAILALAIGFGVTWAQSQTSDGYFNYTGKVAEEIESESPLPVLPPEGKVFYVAEITLKNSDFDSGLDTSKIAWKVKVDGTFYNINVFYTGLHKDFRNMVVEKGATEKYTVVFVIPKNVLVGETEMNYLYASTSENPRISYDSGLTPPAQYMTTADAIAMAKA